MAKVRRLLAATHAGVESEVGSASLVTPPDFDPTNYHFVKESLSNSSLTNIWTFRNTFTTRTPLPFGRSLVEGTTSCAP